MNCFEENVLAPLSPMADYFSGSLINVFVLGVLEFEIPIDDSKAEPLLKNTFLPICPRFSSILVTDKKGKRGWKQVEVNVRDHIKIPTFTSTLPLKLYDECFDEYMSKIAMEQFREDKPLWEMHIFNRSNSVETKGIKIMPKKLPETVSMVFKSAFDFGWSLLKDTVIPDDQTPIRSGHKDVGFRPMTITNVSLSLDSIKEVKNKLMKVSVNDILVAYISAKDMHETNSKAAWGNRFHFMHVPMPILSETNYLNPLDYVFEANKTINRKRNSLAVPLTSLLLRLLNQIKGPQAANNYMYKILNNTSLSISHMVGPVEKVAFVNHPIKGCYFMTVGLSQSITATITSYMGYLRVGFGVEEGFIDEYQLKSCFETSLEMILKAAKDYVAVENQMLSRM
ncbi:hypothetical protein VNO78_13845 [Psophocarpus tetragonolobus]|uniref:O-acyltransferase WSD1 C-terminal domain-containing protein n=1 Tax=Psophocarpus tetragonolobus TaxID=3891 RepID=A0AAN9SPT2_PSOTE